VSTKAFRGECVAIDRGDHRSAVREKRDRLVAGHLDLVRRIAERIARSLPPSFDLDDLIQTGNVALLRAANQYRPELHGDTPFECFARPIVHGRIIDSIRRSRYDEQTRPSIDAPGIHERHAVVVPIDAKIDNDRREARVRQAIGELPERMREVLAMRYDHGMKFAEIAAAMKVHPSRASQIHVEAIELIRSSCQN